MYSWCRLKENVGNSCYVNSVCIFHTSLLRGIGSLWSMTQNYNTGSFIVATSTMHCSSLWIAWKLLCMTKLLCIIQETSSATGYTAESQNSVGTRYSHVASVAPQQLYIGLKCIRQNLSTFHVLLIFVDWNKYILLLATLPAWAPGDVWKFPSRFLIRECV